MCLIVILTSVVIVNAEEVEESSQGGGASASFGADVIDMSKVMYYINGTGSFASGGGSRHRWTGDLTVKMRLSVSAFALAQGIVFDDPATSDAILDFYNSLSEIDKKKINAISELLDNVEDAYNVIATVSKDVADYMTTLISSFFTRERYFSGAGEVDYGQTVSYNGHSTVDLSQANQIYITTQAAADPSPNSRNCHVDYRISSGFVLRSYYHSTSVPSDVLSFEYSAIPDDFCLFIPDNGDLFGLFDSARFANNSIYSNLAFDFSNYVLTFKSSSNSVARFPFVNNYCFVSKSKRTMYRITSVGNKFSFVTYDSSLYNSSLFFDTATDAVNYFLNQGGMSVTEPYAVQEPVSSHDVIEIDEDKQSDFINQITNMYDGDTISIVIPTTNTYNNFVNQPSLLFDFSQDNLYDSSLNLPSSDGNKWANKFPFCLPFDIYHLFSNFSAEPEAPELHMLVLPANAFGMTNEAYYIDFDFADYNILVQILRFFIALGFVIWLIVITNKITK